MNKPSHVRQYHDSQTSMANKVNRNLSPSLIKIQALEAERIATSVKTASNKAASRKIRERHQLEPESTAPADDATLPPTINRRNTKTSILSEANYPNPAYSSARLTPWIIASITLTLALFSGNYAWQTQQQVGKLAQRLEQIAARPPTTPTLNPLEADDKLERLEEELLALTLAQQQSSATVTARQAAFDAGTQQTALRLSELETTVASLSQIPPQSLAIKSLEDKLRTEPNTKTANEPAITPTENWFINIASFSDRTAADIIYEKVQKTTEKASVKPIIINGKTLYRIRANGYSSRARAENEAQTLQSQLNLSGLWVSRD